MAASKPLAVGIDIGGTHTKIGLVERTGEIRAYRVLSSASIAEEGRDPLPFLQALVEEVERLIDEAEGPVAGVGVSLHGYVNKERTGPIVCPNTPAICGIDLSVYLRHALGLAVLLESDLTAHALAEYFYGSGRGSQRFLCLAIGTGLGAGVVIDGEPLRYLGGCAGDTGHVILEPDGPPCPMGCRGCAEALCGVKGVERLAHAKMGQSLSAREVIIRARAGNPEARAVIEQIGRWLGQLLASLCSIYLPDRVALSGGISEAGPLLLASVQQRFDELVADYHKSTRELGFGFYQGVEFVLGQMRGQTGVVGSVVGFFQEKDNE